MVYRVAFYDDRDGSEGFDYFGNAHEADVAARTWVVDSPNTRQVDIESVKTPTTKLQVLALLRLWATHADNG